VEGRLLKTKQSMIKLNTIRPNPANPRTIKDEAFEKLCRSIEQFPAMMELRPIVTDSEGMILGGNMRFKALSHLGYKEVPETWVKRANELTEDEKRRFIVSDNAAFGEWNMDELLANWTAEELEAWGVDVPAQTETSKLSLLQFEDVYYTPTEKPEIDLIDCINFDKYNAKMNVIEESDIPEDRKEVLRWFAFRFLKIDFENVANYYYFNATDTEKQVIERLRLVLCDGGVDGFIEDDLLKVHNLIEDWQ